MRKKRSYALNSVSIVSGEMIDGKGEDSYACAYNLSSGFVGVFDGCGGTGARRYAAFDSHTGAYVASRLAAYSAAQWWHCSHSAPAQQLEEDIRAGMQILKSKADPEPGGIALMGSLSAKTFPTTASIVACDFSKIPAARFIWAGDSRGYILDKNGLCQVTADDIDGDADAFMNIQSDARVTNVISAEGRFSLHEKQILLKEPCILFAATDGCFSYTPTPMEFEFYLLSALVKARNIYDWEVNLKKVLHKQASDDYTMAAILCGFRNFKEIKQYFKERLHFLNKEYIQKLNAAEKNREGADADMLWQQYRASYYRYE